MSERAGSALAVATLVLAGAPPAVALDDCINRGGDALPGYAHYVDPSEAMNLQALLDQYGAIRLKPRGDYTRSPGLLLRTNQEVYGLAEARLPKVVVAAGTSGAVLSGVAPDGLRFQASDLPVHGNCFERISTGHFSDPLSIVDVTLTGNLFVDIGPGNLLIDTRRQGHLRGNRFIKVEMHSVSPSLQLLGDRSRPSRDNVFIGLSVLTPVTDGVLIQGQEQVNIVGMDAESWNWSGRSTWPAMMKVSDTGALRLFMPHGGDNRWRNSAILDSDAESLQIYGLRFGASGSPAIRLHSGTLSVVELFSQTRTVADDRPDRPRLSLFPDYGTEVLVNGAALSAASRPSKVQQSLLRSMLSGAVAPAGPGWAPASLPLPSTPAGIAPLAQRAAQPDSADQIQALVDANGIAELPVGVYYISKPLRLRGGQGLVGAGASRTAIVAMSPNIDMIVGGDHVTAITTFGLVLADLSLVGGHIGLRHDQAGSGPGAQYNHMVLSHLTIRDMSLAGIYVNGIYGWDNNLIDNLNVINCDIGMLQIVPSSYSGGDVAGMTYLDKNFFYRTRFSGGRRAIVWSAKRPNNLDVFVDSRFSGAGVRAVEMTASEAIIFANVDFEENGGDPQVASTIPYGCVACRFAASYRGESMLDDGTICVECSFQGGSAAGASVGHAGATVALVNSSVSAMGLGAGVGGFFGNTRYANRGDLSTTAAVLRGGQLTTLVAGPADPRPQWMVGDGIH